jgi:hypothetical protein
MKFKLDSTRIKAFFVAHAEKIAVALAAILLVYLSYSAFKVPRYDKKPEDLANDSRFTMENVNRPDNVLKPKEHNIVLPNPEYADQVGKAMVPIDVELFAMSTPWNAPLRETRLRRDEPEYLPPEELHLAYGFGAVAAKDKSRYLGRQWVVVTAIAPMAKQLERYRKLFDNALYIDPALDMPHYATFAVERAEVASPDMPEAQLQWTNLDVAAIWEAANTDFAAERKDLVEKKYVDSNIADFCPPLVGKTFGDEVAHLPEIPLASTDEVAPAGMAPGAFAPGAKTTNPRRGFDQAVPDEAPAAASAPGGKAAQAPVVQTKLIRFFDYTVQSGKTYRYRVKLALNNPNKNVYPRFLKRPELAQGETRQTDWSAPSPAVTTPSDYRILAGDAKVSPSAAVEPLARIIIVRWVPAEGVEVAHEFMKERGSMLDFPGTQATVPAPGNPAQTHSATVDFISNTLLLDISGGDKLTDARGRPFRSPTELVMMGPDGQLILHSSVLDGIAYDSRLQQAEPPPAAAPEGEAPAAAPGGGGLFDSIIAPKKQLRP